MRRDSLKPLQVFRGKRLLPRPAIRQKQASRRVPFLIERHRSEILDPTLLLRRPQPNPSPPPSSQFQHSDASMSSTRNPSERVKGRFSGPSRSPSPDLIRHTNIRSRSASRYASSAPSV